MGYCKLECTEGEPYCCICCDKHEGCDNKCDILDDYEYVEECSEYVKVDEYETN